MSCICLDTNWFLKGLESPCPPDWTALSALFSENSDAFSLPRFPMQVHDVLLAYGIIENPNIRGVNRDLWIHERDWVYCCRFSAQANVPSLLTFDGVDTFADVWLNGTLLGSCSDVYLSWEYDVGHLLRTENTLIVYFHAAQTELKKLSLPERYAGLVPTISAARVFRTGYHDYCGPSPCLIRCGLYAPVTLRQAEPVALAEITCDTWLTEDGDGVVQVQLTWMGQADTPYAVSLADAHGTVVADASGTTAHGRQRLSLSVHQPERWYPWTHGTPTCYTLTVRAEKEAVSRLVGFRQIDISDRLLFRVNGMPVRMWGANLMHLDTLTNCYAPEKMARILDLAQLANCNMLRVWGEADKLPEAFYEECDRRGILLWQDFFLGCSLYSEEEDQLSLYRQEAEMLLRTRKHHPCIALWCGGNELYLAQEYQHPEAPVYGEKIIREVFPEVCARLDPHRLYYPSSPCGGSFANDPQCGDTHGYTHLWFVPGRAYPHFLSENCRVSTPTWQSMNQMMTPDELWEEGTYALTAHHPCEIPESWMKHTPNEGWLKLGPVEHYRDAETPQEMVYRVCAAHAEYIHEQVGRFRRGRAPWENSDIRHTNGHLLWRLNENSNVISFGVVDYFLQPGHAYYEMKRCYAPVFASVTLDDHAGIYLTNDTTRTIAGSVEVSLFHLVKNERTRQMELPFTIEPDATARLCTLDEWGQIRKEQIVCVRVLDKRRTLLAETIQPLDIERRLPYPQQVGLSMIASADTDTLLLRCEHYARCVSLHGDGFDTLFDDNFFDLLPGETKCIRVLRSPSSGVIYAETAYDQTIVSCQWDKEKEK